MCWPTYGVIACEPLGSFQTHEVISDENVKKKIAPDHWGQNKYYIFPFQTSTSSFDEWLL